MNEKKILQTILIAGSLFMVGFCLFPFSHMIITSFSRQPDFLSAQTGFNFTWFNYYTIIVNKSLHFFDYLKNSFIIAGLSSIISVLIAAAAAYAITRLTFPGKMAILFLTLAVSMFPQISILNYLFKFMTRLGWVNTYPALIMPYTALIIPLSLWILVSYFSQIPRELDQSALIDGASRWNILCKIIFPIATPALFSTILLGFIFALNEFMFALMLTTDHHARTIPVGIALFHGVHGQIPWGTIMAASTATTLPIIILTLFFQKYIITGLTRGAVKE